MDLLEIIWLCAFVLFLMVEAGTVSLVSIWFATGALAALVTSWLGGEMWLQIALFLVTSCVTLACLRPFVRRFISPKVVPTNADSLVGTEVVLSVSVDNLKAQGEVVLNGVTWTARSTGGEPLEAGSIVRVDRIEGVRVFVSPVSVETKV